jgi:autotransporter-associated beta strand protein
VLTAGDNTSTTFSGVVQDGSGTVGLTKAGSGTLTLTGTNTYTGGTILTTGALEIGNGGGTGSIVGDVVDNGELIFDRDNPVTFAGTVSETGGLTQAGSGTLILTGTNDYAGGTLIAAGTLQLGNDGPTGTITGNVLDDGALVFAHDAPLTFAGLIEGTGTLALNDGTLILTGDNNCTGLTRMSLS